LKWGCHVQTSSGGTGRQFRADAPVRIEVTRIVPHVLVVDDEALIRWSVCESLVARGMKVTQAADGASTMRLLEGGAASFDVVVLDLRLPDVNDLSLVANVRSLSPQSTVILMTAFGTPEVAGEAMALGASRILHKPFELDDLAALVEAAVISKAIGYRT
jgi:DNA-binding NtrC family response regulator